MGFGQRDPSIEGACRKLGTGTKGQSGLRSTSPKLPPRDPEENPLPTVGIVFGSYDPGSDTLVQRPGSRKTQRFDESHFPRLPTGSSQHCFNAHRGDPDWSRDDSPSPGSTFGAGDQILVRVTLRIVIPPAVYNVKYRLHTSPRGERGPLRTSMSL